MSPPAASTIPLQMLVGAVVVLALTAAANAVGGGSCTTPCPYGTCPSGCPVTSCPLTFYEGGDAVHLFNGACVSWAKDFDNSIDVFRPGATPFVANTDTLQWQWAAPGARALGVAKAGILKELADEFTLTVADDGNSGDTWVAVQEFGDGLSKVHGEYKVPFTQAFTAQLKGMWFVIVRNWAAIPVVNGAQWNPGSFTATLRCAGGHAFLQAANTGSISCPARVAEGKCQYDAIGFNPFERWNVFLGLAGPSNFGQCTVEGRVACAVNDPLQLVKANVHTVAEPWISAADSKWSVASVGTVALDGTTILNGGVATGGDFKGDRNSVSGDIAKNQGTLSAELGVAAEYFNSRSRAWQGRATSVIDSAFKGATLTVRLHGKVNFLNIKGDKLLQYPTIVLTGHPLGTLIINVDAGKDLTFDDHTLWMIFVANADGKGFAEPAFGRVLFNFFNLQQLVLNNLDRELYASILAPLAQTTLTQSPGVRGNVIVGALRQIEGTIIKLSPFGTSPDKLLPPVKPKPTPKKWTAAGKKAVACLWHEL